MIWPLSLVRNDTGEGLSLASDADCLGELPEFTLTYFSLYWLG